MSYTNKKGVINKRDISPDEFVEYIKNAEYVLTSSFHGMALSIVLEKQFYYDLDISKKNNNSRLETLSEMLSLKHRMLNENSFKQIDENSIDYSQVNETLNIFREQSIDFLKRSLKL